MVLDKNPVYTADFVQIIGSAAYAGFFGVIRRHFMNIYDNNEDHLSTVAVNCRYLSCKQLPRHAESASGVSCSDCRNWTGSGCSRKHFESIASELQLD
jgi:hypothetical protein